MDRLSTVRIIPSCRIEAEEAAYTRQDTQIWCRPRMAVGGPFSYPMRHHLGRETFLAPVTWTADGLGWASYKQPRRGAGSLQLQRHDARQQHRSRNRFHDGSHSREGLYSRGSAARERCIKSVP